MGYWEDRQAESLAKISNKSVKNIEKQMQKYYAETMEQVIYDFEATYNKLLTTIEDGRQPTPADLYKLDKYWKLQAQCRTELEKLGAKQLALLSKEFETNWFEVYYSINIEGATAFSTVDKTMVEQMINQIWCADGKSWSARIWDDTKRLQETLNESLIHTVAAGRKTTDLKNALQERFGVSYSRADALVRTEISHIQNQAAQKRYEDYGAEEVEIWADEDERRCEICAKLHQKKYPIGAAIPIPAHPRCRCSILPVIKTDIEEKKEEFTPPVEKRERRRNIEDYKRNQAPQFEAMSKKEVEEWSKANLKTPINFKGSSEYVARTTAKAIHKLEAQGIDLGDISIEFGNTGSSYGLFNRNTKKLSLRGSEGFIEKMKELDMKSYAKYNKPYYANTSYEGVLYHELGHALDDTLNHELSKRIAYNDRVFEQSLKLSFYSASRPHDIRANKATETFAEAFSAYMGIGEQAEKVPSEIKKWIEECLKKKIRK